MPEMNENSTSSFCSEQVEAWLDDNQSFVHDYFLRKASQSMINGWLADRVIKIATPDGTLPTLRSDSSGGSGKKTSPTIDNEAIEPQHLPLKPMVSTNKQGSPSFYTPTESSSDPQRKISLPITVRRISHNDRVIEVTSTTATKCKHTRRLLPSSDERDMIMELVRDIAMDLDVTSVSHRILQNVLTLINADRSSLFLVKKRDGERFLVSRLFDVSKHSSLEDNVVRENEIWMKFGEGIAGKVAITGKSLNIPDAYQDPRFTKRVDGETGYKTNSILCMPIKDGEDKIVGVAQVINKSLGEFTKKDEKIFASYLGFCGIAIHNAQLFEKVQLENRRNEVLLDLARVLFEEQNSLNVLMDTILTHTTSLLGCERASILLADSSQPDNVFTRTFEHVSDEDNFLASSPNINGINSQQDRKVPFNLPVTSYVRQTGQGVNIYDLKTDNRFDIDNENDDLEFQTQSLLCFPIRDSLREVIGVIQLINKKDKFGHCFSKSDEQILEAFAIFCGIGISNTRMYEETAKIAARQQVVLEVLSYHAVAPPAVGSRIATGEIKSAKSYDLLRYQFDDTTLSDLDTMKASVRMFIDLNLIEKFHINFNTLCRWVASVKRNYRNVRYHNWRHAFNVCQTIFCMIKTGGLKKIFSKEEQLGLLIASLSHDLDHRGTNNAFQAKIEHPLARLYSTSTLEYHHFNQCLMLLQSEGCEILSQLSPAEYSHQIKLVQHAILSTDLAIYFKRRQSFFDVMEEPNWEVDSQRELLRGMAMTATDVSAITKPWHIEYKIAQQVAEEFFEQGDIEKKKLHQEPIDMMNRNLKHKLPAMQVGFIDSICTPLYKTMANVSSGLQPMLEGCLDNRRHWKELAEQPKE